MFIQLKLKSFRQHKDLTVNFQNGVVALRGANEAGKTTLLEAISFALGGARMLREPLAEVVSWGEKEASLKVWLTFAVNGVTYYITRGKSGAEIKNDTQILATGQNEVTSYVETLIGCEMKTATKLMLANQQKLRGTLEEDGAAMKLIEELADFQLIDRIVALVQKHRPCGTTATVEARMVALSEQLAVPVEDDTGPVREIAAAAEQAMNDAGQAYAAAKADYDAAQGPAQAAQGRLDDAERKGQAVATAELRLASAKVTLEGIKPVPGPTETEIAALRQAVADVGLMNRAANALQRLQKVPEPQWEGSHADLVKERDAFNVKREQALFRAMALGGEINTLKAQMITASACGLCGKDLANVPEVVTKNGELAAQIQAKEVDLQIVKQEEQDARENFTAYNGVVAAGAAADATFHSCAEFITLDCNFTPAKWTWTGPDTTITNVPTDAPVKLQQAEAKVRQYQMDLGRQHQAQNTVNAAQCYLDDCTEAHVASLAAVGDADMVLAAAAVVTSNLYTMEQMYREAEKAYQLAGTELQHAERILEVRKQGRQQIEAQLEASKKELVGMQFNNTLVDTLRKARPSIVEDLWNMVSASVSDTFSRIRGVPSVFARSGDSFTVDGRGIKGLSGSTLDALGLAIRMVLTKTFLPNTRFLVLDEPASAADENRESNMLGVIASSEFDQVILVTHSDLADTFAAQVVSL